MQYAKQNNKMVLCLIFRFLLHLFETRVNTILNKNFYFNRSIWKRPTVADGAPKWRLTPYG